MRGVVGMVREGGRRVCTSLTRRRGIKVDVSELIPRNDSAITAQLAVNELINAVTPHAERR